MSAAERGIALKRMAPTAAEPNGVWQAGREKFTTADLVGVLAAEPERISPAALLRPVFQDYLPRNVADCGWTRRDCVLRAVGGVVRAHPGTDDSGRSQGFRNAD